MGISGSFGLKMEAVPQAGAEAVWAGGRLCPRRRWPGVGSVRTEGSYEIGGGRGRRAETMINGSVFIPQQKTSL